MADVTLSEAAERFARTLKPTALPAARNEVTRFVDWFGRENAVTQLRGHDIELYAEKLGPSGLETSRRADHVRSFLTFLHKYGLTETRLATHLRLRKSGARPGKAAAASFESQQVELTQDGIDSLRAELGNLVAQRPAIREEIRHAMLDKDFRENAPLDAAKDKQGHLEARIRDIESMLKRAVVVDSSADSARVRVGTTVQVTNLKSGGTNRFAIVGPTEANAADGRISSDSPVGKALLRGRVGDEVEVSVPAGVMRFRIEQIE
ncbi:MAG: transcription elongation factor GreA [Chloroflexi bacterium]|nr:MAG: transcription elongation factor GreA [Chloroflexota bacterium]